MNRWHTRSFKTDDITSKRIDALAKQEDRTASKMLDILVHEALNQRECAAAIRQADKSEIDMRFCSPHCRHLATGKCFCTSVYDARGCNPMLGLTPHPDKYARDKHCPYTLKDFQWWQRGADMDAEADKAREQAE